MSEPAAKYGSNRTIDIGGGVELDLDILLRTRLLVQANSGGGKSWLLRRLAEQMFGKLQVIIIDPEGEFATLREQFGYVLVGKGGETPADVRSAGLVAHKLLELNASAVCDLYEMRSDARHEWVAKFLEALVDAPKRLWHPTLIVVDEAQMFCPEKGAGESEASAAVVDLCTRGRKRGFAAVLATQRLGKLRKDAAAELGNVLVGRTTLDIDRERAADCLGITKAAKPAFFAEIKVLEDGQFYALGRAISIDRVLVKVGPVQTTHPEPGSSRHSAAPPPAPEKIRALLPKLADLPKEAEAKARTEAELRQEINGLQARIRQLEHAAPAAQVKTVEVPVLLDEDRARIDKFVNSLSEQRQHLGGVADEIRGALAKVAHGAATVMLPAVPRATIAKRPETRAAVASIVQHASRRNESVSLDKCQRAILAVLAQHVDGCQSAKLALLAGYRWSGGFRNALSALRMSGRIQGGNGETMRITVAGVESLGDYDPLPVGAELHAYWLGHPSLGKCERECLRELIRIYPAGLSGADLAPATGYEWSGGFRNALSALRTAGLIVGKNSGELKASGALFG